MNRRQLAVVHLAKKQVGMTDDEYRDLLGSVGVESSKDLDKKGFSVVMKHFEQIGFKSKSKFRPGNTMETLPANKKPYVKKIEAILQELKLKREYADGIARNRFGVDRYHWLDTQQLRKVMQMLIYHQKRRKADARRKKGA